MDQMRIFALVGASGTGKSHRASLVAMDQGVDTIIDDGLLIHQGRIIAGFSAKREATRVAAVKRAILADPIHAQLMREGLASLNASTVLILGTSKNMVQRILVALNWSALPVQYTYIEDVTTAEEREIARKTRRQGKHVIPAPTFEVKKSFAGYIVDPLRFMLRGTGRHLYIEKSIVRPTYSSLGKFFISDTVVTAVATHVAQHSLGIARVNHVLVQSTRNGLQIAMEVTLGQPTDILGILRTAQREVGRRIEAMTALNVLSVAIVAKKIEGLTSKERES